MISPQKLKQAFHNLSKNETEAVDFIQLMSHIDLTEAEVIELVAKDKEWARAVKLFKQKCLALQIAIALKDKRNIMKYLELTYYSQNSAFRDEEWNNLSTIE